MSFMTVEAYFKASLQENNKHLCRNLTQMKIAPDHQSRDNFAGNYLKQARSSNSVERFAGEAKIPYKNPYEYSDAPEE